MPIEPVILDLTACDRELIRVPGGIQPHGVLLVADPTSLLVLQASANAAAILDGFAGDPVGRSLRYCVGTKRYVDLAAKLEELRGHASPPLKIGAWRLAKGQLVDCVAHVRDGLLLVELEFVASDRADPADLTGRIIQFSTAFEGVDDAPTLCAIVARQVRELIDFDRVMVYQFDREWNGTVVGEAGNGRLPSYFDLRFPAGDIPAQARELYRTNRSRLICTADYEAVPLIPSINPQTGRVLDMTFSTLRSVSPVHLEYMKNMGTAASASFSILRNGELWGLIACHNSEPRMISFDVRRACELIVQTFSLQLTAHETREAVGVRVRLGEVRSRLLTAMAASTDYASALPDHADDLLACVGARGAAIVTESSLRLVGETPDEADVRAMVEWVNERQLRDVYATNQISDDVPTAERFKHLASGVLAVSISKLHKSFLIWFRPEVVRTVTWAGDVRRASTAGRYEEKLHPRHSFEAWKETVVGTATPWQPAEIDSARALRANIVDIVLRRAEELAAVSEQLEISNKELEAFSYTVSHDLRAPFRHIMSYSELVNQNEASRLTDRGRRHVQTVIDAARTAGKLIDNLLAFSHMSRSGLHCITIDMDQLLVEVKAEVLAAEGVGREIEWRVSRLPATYGDPNMLRLALRNLLSNAVKYTRGRPVAEIQITAVDSQQACVYAVRDNGVGFDMKYVDKLFGVFQRLHRIEDFEGTGIGLANVRRIVGRHGGTTWAEGVVDGGATFFISMPHRTIEGGT